MKKTTIINLLTLTIYGANILTFYLLVKHGNVETSSKLLPFSLGIVTIISLFIILLTMTKPILRKILSYFDPWVLLIAIITVSYKYPIITVTSNIIICCLLCAYVSTLSIMLVSCYRGKEFSIYDIFAWGLRTFIIIFTIKYFVLNGPISDILCALHFSLMNLDLNSKLHLGPDLVHFTIRGPRSDITPGADLDNPVEQNTNSTVGQNTNNLAEEDIERNRGAMLAAEQQWISSVDRLEAAAVNHYNRPWNGRSHKPDVRLSAAMNLMGANAIERQFFQDYFTTVVGYTRSGARIVKIYGGNNVRDDYFEDMRQVIRQRFAR